MGYVVELKKLAEIFYAENTHLVEVMDKSRSGKWAEDKTRGYGIVVCEYNGLRFGIPLRSNITHRHCFKTVDDKGLDFSKSVLLQKDEYISGDPFTIPNDEHKKIIDSANVIQKRFSKYVEHYVKGVQKADANILRPYAFSTLKNYHAELGI